MPDNQSPLRHLDYSERGRTRGYKAKPGGGGRRAALYPRRRSEHAAALKGQLELIQTEDERRRTATELSNYSSDVGTIIEIVGEATYPLEYERLDSKTGVVLLNSRKILTRDSQGVEQEIPAATVFVKHGSLVYFTRRVKDYAEKSTAAGDPRNAPLIANISSIGLAAIEAYWTSAEPLPNPDVETWWEVWVRRGESEEKRQRHNDAVLAEAQRHGMEVNPFSLRLPEHTVFLIKATRAALANAIVILNFTSELRPPTKTAAFFMAEPRLDQAVRVDELKSRLQLTNGPTAAVCVLDTGVNRGHPLLEDVLPEEHQDTVDDEWGKDDFHIREPGLNPTGHGTAMAGLAVYGDLTEILASSQPVPVKHALESVKILPRVGSNKPEHYGPVTQQAMAIAESNAPSRQRVFCLAVTATDSADFTETGKPSAWSSALDSYASGALDENQRRLICVSAGNIFLENPSDYPNLNKVSPPEDPAQAWNVLTVGAYTDKDTVRDSAGNLVESLQPIASQGGLSPRSRTSLLWKAKESRDWPFKPDVVLEGGNCAHESTGFIDDHDSLSLLTTHFQFQDRLLTTTGDTSAATALACRMAAQLWAEYPSYWPETIRALIVHSAQWASEMLRGINLTNATKDTISDLLHTYGYGRPDFGRAVWSAKSRATLICEDSIQPFIKHRTGTPQMNEMMVYKLPWPKSVLLELGDTPVRLRVTLSYFIEPNPGSRAANNKYRYQSCGLRFRLQSPTETLTNLIARVSADVTEGDRVSYRYPSDVGEGWLIGSDNCSRGSIHADVWTGTGAALSSMEHLVVFPVNGWWRLRPQLGRTNSKIRYSLIMSLESDAAEVDLYTAIATEIAAEVAIQV